MPCNLTQTDMQSRFTAYQKETTDFLFRGGWADMSIADRDAKQAEIDARHGYRHGWITVDGQTFDRGTAFPDEVFANVWD